MSGSGRKRKSLWDCMGEPQLSAQIIEKDALHEKGSCSGHNVGHDPKWPDLEDENAKGTLSQKEDRRDLNDFPDARKAWDGDKSYHASSAFDRLEPQNRSRSPENSRNMSSRYRRNRSRDRDRGMSRSPSRGRGRSRDRDWDRGMGRSRSRSPLGNYRQESYRWTDRKGSGLGRLPSQPCREFASGKCRRGSECRFLHQDNLDHKDGGQSEIERSGRWRTAQERGGNGYDGEKDEHSRSSSKSTALCNDFTKGRCHRGSFCRFSHDDATGYNSERGNRDSSFDHNYKRRSRTNGNTPCKFFMMGNCNRDNCRFSHDGPGPGYTEGKSLGNTWSKDFDDTNNSWKGPKWGEATAVSDVSQFTGWSNVGKETCVDDTNNSWKGPKWGEATAVTDVSQFTGWSNVGKETFVDEMNKPRSGPKWGEATTVPDVSKFTGLSNVGKETFVDEMNKPCSGPKWGEATAVTDVSQFTGWSNVGKETFVDEINKPWSGPKWGEATAVPDVSQSTGWGNVEVETFIDPAPAEKRTDDRRSHSLEDKNKSGPKWGDSTGVSEIVMSTRWGNSSGENTNLADLAYAEKHPDVAKSLDSKYPPRSPHGLQSLTPFQISEDVHEQIIGQEASGRSPPTTVVHSIVPEDSLFQQRHNQMGDSSEMTDDFNSLTEMDVYASAPHPALVPVQNSNKKADSFPSVGGIDQNQNIVSANPSNGLDIDLNGPVRQNYSPSNLQNQSQIQHGESVQKIVNSNIPLNVVNNEQVGELSTFPSSLMQIIGNGQLPQLYAALNPQNSIELVSSFPHSANFLPTVMSTNTQPDAASISQKQCNSIAESIKLTKNDATEQNSAMLLKRSSPPSTVGFDSVKLHKNDFPVDNSQRSPELRQQKVTDSGYEENHKSIAEKQKLEQENMRTGNVHATPRILDGNTEKDEKIMRLFKIALVEFVKEILKPKWKEGQMSREVHKNIVKKVVDKVTSTIPGANVPKTQDKIDQYLSYSKPKLTKLVEAYAEKFSKCP